MENDTQNRFELKKWGGGKLKSTKIVTNEISTGYSKMIEQHVTSLELSKRLHELGVKKKSIYYWVDGKLLTNFNDTYLDSSFIVRHISPYSNFERYALNKTFVYPAYLASELLELVPRYTNFEKTSGSCIFSYYSEIIDSVYYQTPDKNLCNSLAKMLIYLIENDIVKVEDLH